MSARAPTGEPGAVDTLDRDALARASRVALEPVERALGARVVRALCVSPRRPADRARAAFRVELADGRAVKLRGLRTPERAREVEELLRAADEPALARVLAREGHVLVEEWVEGEPLPSGAPEELLGEGARLLARLHARTRAGGRALPFEAASAPWLEAALSSLGALLERGHLGEAETARLAARLRELDPGSVRCVLVHGDLCGENLVVDARGALRAIDNEGISLAPAAYDLARAHTRWRLDEPERRAFASAYRGAGGALPTEDERRFWLVQVLARSARLRCELGVADVEEPLRGLRSLAR